MAEMYREGGPILGFSAAERHAEPMTVAISCEKNSRGFTYSVKITRQRDPGETERDALDRAIEQADYVMTGLAMKYGQTEVAS